jgi:serine protease Do
MRLIASLLLLIFTQYAQSAELRTPEINYELVYQLKASVVKVHVATKNGGHGVGTGVVVAKDMVATNCHVVADAVGVKITKFGDSFTPDAMRADWKHDVCVLRFQFLDMPPVVLGDSENLKYEQGIFSIGFPGGPPKPITTPGKIKALYALDGSQVIRTDASFVMGASGSPVFDDGGKLIALSTVKSPGHSAYFYNVPVKWIKALLDNAEETNSLVSSDTPFWAAADEQRPYFMRVVLPYQNAKWDELEKIAQEWVSKEPASEEAHFYLGVAFENLGKTDAAKNELAEALKLHPQHAATLQELGLMANKAGNQPELSRLKLAMQKAGGDVLAEFNELINPTPDLAP